MTAFVEVLSLFQRVFRHQPTALRTPGREPRPMQDASADVRDVVACPDCDLLQHAGPLPDRGHTRCVRCGSVLQRSAGDPRVALALASTTLLTLIIANFNTIIALEFNGQTSTATLLGATRQLVHQQERGMALLVLVTTLLVPLAELSAMIYLLLPRRDGRLPPGFARVLRVVDAIEPWGMVEVFVLGVLVAFVKLSHVAHIVPGVGMWSFGVLMALTAATAMNFDTRSLWCNVPVTGTAG